MRTENTRQKVGELRPSQMLFTFGVGSVLDLPHMSVIIMGLEDWDSVRRYMKVISEERLLAAVQKQLGHQVNALLSPPRAPDKENELVANSDAENIGVPVAPFPRWMRCPRCNLLSCIESGLFVPAVDRYHPDRTGYKHQGCPKARGTYPFVLPVRFLIGCRNGHIDDFPWVKYVHGGNPCDRPTLFLSESGASGDPANIWVRCANCNAKRPMQEALGQEFKETCSGRRPHLRDYEEACSQQPRVVLLGASNTWFPVTMSAFSIPASSDILENLVERNWAVLSKARSPEVIRAFREIGQLADLAEYPDDKIWSAVEKRRNPEPDREQGGPPDLKQPEWETFSNPDSAPKTPDFDLRETEIPEQYEGYFSRVVLVDRLREVRTLVGFTRIEAPPDPSEGIDEKNFKPAPLSRGNTPWVPAIEVRGEGLFIQFKEETIQQWCQRPEVKQRENDLLTAHRNWRRTRLLEPEDAGFPGIRYALLHSFAHALVRELCLECGYAAASVRERIYAWEESSVKKPSAGILLYTAAPDSEGTLGGLVALGEPDNLIGLIEQTLDHMTLCASDPLCSEHAPSADGLTLHGAACHACLFLPETACECGNRYLDRALLVQTLSSDKISFFNTLEVL